MALTLGEAAKAANRSKTTISRAIASGKLSASRNPDGSFSIDRAELQRVYPADTAPDVTVVKAPDTDATALLREMLEAERSRVRDLMAERDRLLAMLEQREQLMLPAPGWWRRWRGK